MFATYSALESIDHQGLSSLAMDLEIAITKLRDLKRVGELDAANSGISKIIKKHTNLTVTLHVVPGINAYIVCPFTSQNNVMHNDYNKFFLQNRDTNKILEVKEMFKGTIDLKRSKVHGDFEDLYGEITLGEAMLWRNSRFTPGQVTAILLHEIGHMFVLLEMITRYSRTNYVMEAGMRHMLEAETKEQRILVLKQLENIYGSTIEDMERIAATKKNKNYYRTVFMSEAIKESYNQLGVNLYDLRGFEQLADQFASRHGKGRDLAIGLDNLYRMMGDRVYWSASAHYFLMAVEAITFVTATIFTAGLFALVLATVNYEIYDPLPRRLEKVKLDAQHALKDREISKKEKDALLKDVEIINNLLAEVKDNESFLKFFWNEIVPWGRAQKKEIVFNEDLERMLNNSLFASAAELKA